MTKAAPGAAHPLHEAPEKPRWCGMYLATDTCMDGNPDNAACDLRGAQCWGWVMIVAMVVLMAMLQPLAGRRAEAGVAAGVAAARQQKLHGHDAVDSRVVLRPPPATTAGPPA